VRRTINMAIKKSNKIAVVDLVVDEGHYVSVLARFATSK
jgi:hypothetical protein